MDLQAGKMPLDTAVEHGQVRVAAFLRDIISGVRTPNSGTPGEAIAVYLFYYFSYVW